MLTKFDQLLLATSNKYILKKDYQYKEVGIFFTTNPVLERAVNKLKCYGELGWLRTIDLQKKGINFICPETIHLNDFIAAIEETLAAADFELYESEEAKPDSPTAEPNLDDLRSFFNNFKRTSTNII